LLELWLDGHREGRHLDLVTAYRLVYNDVCVFSVTRGQHAEARPTRRRHVLVGAANGETGVVPRLPLVLAALDDVELEHFVIHFFL